jgi:Rod binding domain-containing protein
MAGAASLGPLLAGVAVPGVGLKTDDPAKIRGAAQQFEALLLEQVLHSARGDGSGWLGTDADSAGGCATDLGEQQLALAVAQNGGLGLAKLIASGLGKK